MQDFMKIQSMEYDGQILIVRKDAIEGFQIQVEGSKFTVYVYLTGPVTLGTFDTLEEAEDCMNTVACDVVAAIAQDEEEYRTNKAVEDVTYYQDYLNKTFQRANPLNQGGGYLQPVWYANSTKSATNTALGN